MPKSLEQLRGELRDVAQEGDSELDDGDNSEVAPFLFARSHQKFLDGFTGLSVGGRGYTGPIVHHPIKSRREDPFRKRGICGVKADFVIDEVGRITEGGIAPGLLPIFKVRPVEALPLDTTYVVKFKDAALAASDRADAIVEALRAFHEGLPAVFPEGVEVSAVEDDAEDT